MKVTGRCHCGQISFEAEIDPAQVRICHCTDCQTLTGTASRTTVPSLPSSFVLKSGTPKIYIKTAESGNKRVHAFCPECGTPIYAAAPGANLPSHGLRVGTLDRRAELRPTRQRLHSLELQHVKSGAVVGEVHHALRIDKAVCGLDDLRAGWDAGRTCALVRAARKTQLRAAGTHSRCQRPGRRHCRENEAGTQEGARPVLLKIMRPEIAASGAVLRCKYRATS